MDEKTTSSDNRIRHVNLHFDVVYLLFLAAQDHENFPDWRIHDLAKWAAIFPIFVQHRATKVTIWVSVTRTDIASKCSKITIIEKTASLWRRPPSNEDEEPQLTAMDSSP